MPDIVGYVAKKYMNDQLVNRLAAEDPYYENIEIEKQGKKQKKRVKRQLPVGLTKHNEKVLKSCRRRAYCLDLFFSLCGFRAGWTAIIGLIPLIGDVINLYLGMALIRHAEQIEGGIPAMLRSQMMLNVMIDFGLGLTPVLGDIAGAIYKSNSRNYILLEHHIREKLEHGGHDLFEHSGTHTDAGAQGTHATHAGTSAAPGAVPEPVAPQKAKTSWFKKQAAPGAVPAAAPAPPPPVSSSTSAAPATSSTGHPGTQVPHSHTETAPAHSQVHAVPPKLPARDQETGIY